MNINRVERVEKIGMDDRAEELRELASEVGQIAYGVYEYFGNGLYNYSMLLHALHVLHG